ncbi:hypothetical protein [Anaerosporobacter faecicola]|uniref:hypothetical protein n=1 Tax=Anaerosporobacter faecicola TaxID=2718714 RepID=UPI00143B21DE|nr:hypothetical protein [Anaerosporobacter faecicola]
MANITTDIRCPYCKIGFEVNVDLEEADEAELEGETSFDVDFDEMECPNCENYFAMHGKVEKVGDEYKLTIEEID